MLFYTFERAIGVDETEPHEPYREFLSTLDPKGAVYRFATTISLNDAYPDCVRFDAASGELQLLLLTGDLQVGYWHTELIYTGAAIENESELKAALQERPSEIWYDEFSSLGGRLYHSFLLVPQSMRQPRDRQFHITFETFTYRQVPAEGRILSKNADESVWS